MLDAALALVPQAAGADDRNFSAENEWYYGVLVPLLEARRQFDGTYPAAFEKLDAAVAKAPALKVMRLQLKGDYLTRYGGEARGPAWPRPSPRRARGCSRPA